MLLPFSVVLFFLSSPAAALPDWEYHHYPTDHKCFVNNRPGPRPESSIKSEDYCTFCFRSIVYKYNETTRDLVNGGEKVWEEAGCEDGDGPAVADWNCGGAASFYSEKNDFMTVFRAEDEKILVFKRCCRSLSDYACNKPFHVPFHQVYLGKPPDRESSVVGEAIFLVILTFLLFIGPVSRNWGGVDDATETASQLKKLKIEDPPLDVDSLSSYDESPATRKISGYLGVERIVDVLYHLEYHDPDLETERSMPIQHSMERKEPLFDRIQLYKIQHGTILKPTDRKYPSAFSSFVLRLVEHGPYIYKFKPLELMEQFDKARGEREREEKGSPQAKDLFAMDPPLLKLPAPIVVVGDLRGKYHDLYRIFQACGWPPGTKYLFLGGVLDEGEAGSIECLALIASLKIACPHSVFMTRGIGEMFPFVPEGRFSVRKAEAIGGAISRMCSVLSTCAIVDGRVLAVHSGISPLMKSKYRLGGVVRPCDWRGSGPTTRKVIFSEPSSRVRMFRASGKVSGADIFGPHAVKTTCAHLGVQYIVRSRTPLPQGLAVVYEERLVNIWSCMAKEAQRSTVLEILPHNNQVVHLFDPSTQVIREVTTRPGGATTPLEDDDDGFDKEMREAAPPPPSDAPEEKIEETQEDVEYTQSSRREERTERVKRNENRLKEREERTQSPTEQVSKGSKGPAHVKRPTPHADPPSRSRIKHLSFRSPMGTQMAVTPLVSRRGRGQEKKEEADPLISLSSHFNDSSKMRSQPK